nr:winged helix DNA-binding domain-containing protein [Geodermatophilaceae bacterium]
MAALTEAQLNRATLARQMLLQREPIDPATAVSRLCALQAQAAASPYLALWTRLEPFDPVDLDRALDDGTVVKTTLMRSTLHAVAAVDHPDFW